MLKKQSNVLIFLTGASESGYVLTCEVSGNRSLKSFGKMADEL